MSPTPVPVMIRGTLYPSISAAARALGVTRQAIQSALNRGSPDTAGLGRNWWHRREPDMATDPEPTAIRS